MTGLTGRYASALFDLAEENNVLDDVAKDLALLQELIDETGKVSPELARLFPLQAERNDGSVKPTTPLPTNKLQPGVQNRHSSNDSSQTTLSSMISTDGGTVTTKAKKENNNTLSPREVERDRGKPLSKYERNVMIFDWLHTLDENATIDLN